MFGFDEQYPMFDVTPVDNQFILEYLPNASGDAVRVYLYGLMQCYHPQAAMTMEQMARELGITENEVLTAYRHWERKGLVRRISDQPPRFRYVSIKQLAFMGGAVPVDHEYDAFASALYAVFGNERRLHGGEISRCWEWVEEFCLPPDVVICLVTHMVKLRGKSVGIKTIEKTAMQLAEEKISTVEDAEAFFLRDKTAQDACRAVLRRMGKRRAPSEDEMALCRKWLEDWGFRQDDLLAACAEMVKGDPSFKYLDSILNRLHGQRTATGERRSVAETLSAESEAAAPLRALLKVLGVGSSGVNAGSMAVYEEMRALYPDAIILLAGEHCSRHNGRLDDVMQTLHVWKHAGLADAAEINAFMARVQDQNRFLTVLYQILGVQARPNAADRRLVQKWQDELGYGEDFITQCAPWAVGTERPMAYLAAMLEGFRQKGVRTLADAEKERASFREGRAAQPAAPVRGPRVVGEQQYSQRAYTHTDSAADDIMKQYQEENGDA